MALWEGSVRCGGSGFAGLFLIVHTRCAVGVLSDSADGYISNTCVDIDYEAVKRALFQSRMDPLQLPPPPPDPPQLSNMDFDTRDRYCRRRIWVILCFSFNFQSARMVLGVDEVRFHLLQLTFLFSLMCSANDDEGKQQQNTHTHDLGTTLNLKCNFVLIP